MLKISPSVAKKEPISWDFSLVFLSYIPTLRIKHICRFSCHPYAFHNRLQFCDSRMIVLLEELLMPTIHGKCQRICTKISNIEFVVWSERFIQDRTHESSTRIWFVCKQLNWVDYKEIQVCHTSFTNIRSKDNKQTRLTFNTVQMNSSSKKAILQSVSIFSNFCPSVPSFVFIVLVKCPFTFLCG